MQNSPTSVAGIFTFVTTKDNLQKTQHKNIEKKIIPKASKEKKTSHAQTKPHTHTHNHIHTLFNCGLRD